MAHPQHTPAPWTASPANAGEWEIDGDGWSIAVVCGGAGHEGPNGSSDANARLIAAAPELLAEYKRLYSEYVRLLESGRDRIISLGGDCDPVDVMERGNAVLVDARALIAKAEGTR